MTISVSKGEMLEALKHKIDKPEKFTLIYNAISDKDLPSKVEARKRIGLDVKAKLVGVTARCSEQKNPFEFLAIAEKVINSVNDVEFAYIGDGIYFDEMKEWIIQRNLDNKIHMIGYRSDAAEIVGALDVYLSTALFEGLPYSMIEAMRAGVPIVASDVVGNQELVRDGENGWKYDLGDYEKAMYRIKGLLENNTITKDMIRRVFLEEFSIEKTIIKLDLVYNRVYKGI
ncbi:MAG: glycosyltransferase [Lachnospiraceae bacterium]|nr:glycosyltransferase [Lachnospiraceae bacterium]